MTVYEQLTWSLVGMAALMAVLWIIQQWRRDASIVDVGWTAGVGLVTLFLAVTTDGDRNRRVLVAALAGLWSLRLTWHLLHHRIIGKSEDSRYVTLRRRWGSSASLGFFVFFEAQAPLAVVFAVPMLVALHGDRPVGDVFDVAAVAIWLVAVVGEMVADRQLAQFRADPANRGQVCQAGLWRCSRHPNYFFEWLHWWTYVVLAIGQPWWAWTLLGPGLMLCFLFFVTGIPATEAQALASRGDAYRRYQASTSAFFPWFPRT